MKEFYGYIYKTILPEGALNKNGRPFYIGQKKGSQIKNNYFGSGTIIINYIKKYGTQKLQREILSWAVSQEQLNQLEYKYVHPYFGTELCFNLREGGNQPGVSDETRQKMSNLHRGQQAWNKGKHPSEETRKKLSEAKKGKVSNNYGNHYSEEARQKMREAHKFRKPMSEETRQKISEANKGMIRSEETRQKLSMIKKGNQNMLGKTHSVETRKKMSEARLGIVYSEETLKKMSESQKRKPPVSEETRQKISESVKKSFTPEVRKKMSIARLGKPLSEEARQKLSEINKGKTHSEESRKKMSESRKKFLAMKKENNNAIVR
jgi:hypothetical protein